MRRTFRFLSEKEMKWFPKPIRCRDHGIDVLQDPLWNKALAFELTERDRLGLRGLLPPAVRTIDSQLKRTLRNLRSQPDDVYRNLYLQDLHSRNETLFHRLLIDNIEEIAPLVYTPTVGVTCQQFGNKFRRPRGMFFSTQDRGHFGTMVYNWPHDDVHIIVVTDGSRILGLGDLGAQGMGIPIGKLALYCSAGGIAPHRVLPVTLDVGTNNTALLNDENYIGMRHRRLEGDEYYDMVDEFMSAVFERWPNVCVQFEDFETPKALSLLAKYRDRFRCFNDDVQGTGSVTVSALISASKIAAVPFTGLKVLCAGGGSAGQGVCQSILDAMVYEGCNPEEARSRIAIVTHLGCVGRPDNSRGNPHYCGGTTPADAHLGKWANSGISDGTTLLEAIRQHKPNVLLGLTACGGVFTEEVLREMSKYSERPIIFPMSNPTAKAECTAEEAYRCTDGRAIVASGSPFGVVNLNGKVLIPSQCNNMYIFPGIGLAASVGGITRITDRMLYIAAKACAGMLSESEIAEGRTFPHISRIRDVSHAIATAMIEDAIEEQLTTKIKKHHIREGIAKVVARKMYFPEYHPLRSSRSLILD